MKLSLSKLEIKALQLLCRGESTVTQLAGALGISKGLVSRVVKQLSRFNLIRVERSGTEKIINLSFASHAEAFKSLYFSRQNAKIETWLAGKAIEMLIVISTHNKATFKELMQECTCSRPTFYKMIYNLKGAGVLNEAKGEYSIIDPLVRDFAEAYANSIRGLITKDVREFETIIRIGKHCIIRTRQALKPPFYLTGVGKLMELGLKAIPTNYVDYYFSLDERQAEISIEETIVHSLLMSGAHFDTEKPLITIFIKQNTRKLNWFKLNKLADKYGVKNKLYEIKVALDLHQKLVEYNE